MENIFQLLEDLNDLNRGTPDLEEIVDYMREFLTRDGTENGISGYIFEALNPENITVRDVLINQGVLRPDNMNWVDNLDDLDRMMEDTVGYIELGDDIFFQLNSFNFRSLVLNVVTEMKNINGIGQGNYILIYNKLKKMEGVRESDDFI